MTSLLINYSGIISILIAWTLVVLPTVIYGIKTSQETISRITSRSGIVKAFVTIGLITGSIFQALFLIYLVRRYNISTWNLGSILYLSTNLVTILVSVFDEKNHLTIHRILVFYYFIIHPLSILLLGIILSERNETLLIVSICFIISYAIGNLYLFMKYRSANATFEIYSFFLQTVWTLSMLYM